MSKNINYGIATPQVRLLSSLPKVLEERQVYNFDVTAFSWSALQNSPFLSPLLAENVTNPENSFSVCFPSRRKNFVANLVQTNVTIASPPDGTILWTPVPTTGPSTPGVITDYVKNLPSYYTEIENTNPASRIPQNHVQNPNVDDTITTGDYEGPLWALTTYKEQPRPDDQKIIKNFFDIVSGEIPTSTTSEDVPNIIEGGTKTCPHQTRVQDGLWWGAESNDFLDKNMPFWITIDKATRPPSPAENETFFIISLGVDSESNKDRYDLVLSYNKPPTLIDYYGVDADTGVGDEIVREFSSPSLSTSDDRIDIGFMTSGGRLIIFVNDSTLVYTRIVKTGSEDNVSTIKEANITKGKIRLYGSNVGCKFYAYPMTFAEMAIIAFPIPNTKQIDTGNGTQEVDIVYSSPDETNLPTGKPVCLLPVNAAVESANRYGVDGTKFTDVNGSVNLQEAFGLHLEGKLDFISAKSLTQEYSALPNTNFFMLAMRPESRVWLGNVLPFAKTPYFFRLKGVDEASRDDPVISITDLTDDIISLKEDASAPDYFHVKKTVSFTLYNENGKYDYLRFRQFGVDVSWGWNFGVKKSFTGIIISTSNSEVAGKETLTVQCEDYHYILKNTPIVNSPFYDGMLGFHAVKDLAQRAGIKKNAILKDWDNDEAYFLKSGYSFSSPAVRFKTTDKIFECMMTIVKRFEAYIYFDALGNFHIDKLDGGLLGVPPVIIPINFTSNPNDDTGKILILDNKNVDVTLDSTVNFISVLTLDRDTRNPIIFSRGARQNENILSFKKKMMIDQPAYGELDVAKAHAEELAYRVFAPIRKTSFKTVGSVAIIDPLAFVTVDGVLFRLISVSREFSADSNDFIQNYECEWLNG